MTLTAEVSGGDGQWVLRQRGAESETILRKLLSGGEQPERAGEGGAQRRLGVAERRELKLARLKQLMQRSLSESDSDAYPPEDAKHAPGAAPRPERPNQLPVAAGDELPPPPGAPAGLYALMKKQQHHHPHLAQGSTAERKLSFALRTSRSMDGPDPSPTSDPSEVDCEPNSDAGGQKVTTSPKSALKSPSSRRKTAQNLKLRVTFDEPVVHKEAPESEARAAGPEKTSGRGSSESGETWKRPFGTFRSIMETLSGNQNSNNNNGQSGAGSPQAPTGRKTDSKAGASGLPKGRSKPSAV